MDFLFAALGLIILLLAGDFLVRGAVNLSLRLGIPALIVSLTVVAFGTSAPELLIAVASVLDHAPGLALGNVVGSNTANVLLVLGLPALLAGLRTRGLETRGSYTVMLAATALFIGLALGGRLGWMAGLVLLAALAMILTGQLAAAHTHRHVAQAGAGDRQATGPEGTDPEMPGWKIGLFLTLGIVGLPIGTKLLVDSAVRIAGHFGVGEIVIGLTLIAVGTSLPELATTVMAAMRRQADVALGNVIGSNMFNLLAIAGTAALFGDIPVTQAVLRLDLWVMAGASLVLAPFVFRLADISRPWGAVLVTLYALYILTIISQGGTGPARGRA